MYLINEINHTEICQCTVGEIHLFRQTEIQIFLVRRSKRLDRVRNEKPLV